MSGGVVFGRTQLAVQTPFEPNRNPQWSGLPGPSLITSNHVQDAIEEVRTQAIGNDRWSIAAAYNGNANTGRRLEYYPGQDMNTSPLVVSEASKIIAFSVQCTGVATSTVRIYNLTTAATLLDIIFTAQTSVFQTNLAIAGISAGNALEIFIQSGSMSKPRMTLWLSTVT